MTEPLKVLQAQRTLPADAALDEAARLAGVSLERVPWEVFRSDGARGPALFRGVDLIVTDERSLGDLRARLEQTGSSVPILVLCDGSLGEQTTSLLRTGSLDLARYDDAVAIAAALRRVSHSIEFSNGNYNFVQQRNHLEDLVRERTRELEESHQRLRLSERMAAMGTLSTGIGHDIGNLVLPLRIGLESLESRSLPRECEPDLAAIRKSVEYLQGLANGLRYLAMDPEDAGLGAGHSSLHDWWADVEPLLKNCLPREIVLIREFPPPEELPRVAMPLHHLTHIVFNLVQNAGDAMRGMEAGTVRLRAEQAKDSTDEFPLILLSVIDDGPGMDAEVRERCMEPFFTTKFRSVGTGLGLHLVHGLMKKAGGDVALESEPDRGTHWTLTLPGCPAPENRSPGRRAVARVDLSDHRIGAYVSSVLRSLDFEVSEDSDSLTALCVTEPTTALGRAARALLEEDKSLHVILFGDANGLIHDRLHPLGANPSSSTIRAALREVRKTIRL